MKYNEDEIRPRLSGNKRKAFEHLNKKERRILVIGDLHAPFTLSGYLEHCKEVYSNYNCNQVIYIGDILDNHAFSFHVPDPSGLSPGNELLLAKEHIQEWYEAFPVADVLIGNHDRMAARKAMNGGIPSEWIKSYNDVLGTPKWNWCETIVYDDVLFEHGEGTSFERRKWELELAQHYTKEFTPLVEFGRLMFGEWNDAEWCQFDNYMIHNLQKYLEESRVKNSSLKYRVHSAK